MAARTRSRRRSTSCDSSRCRFPRDCGWGSQPCSSSAATAWSAPSSTSAGGRVEVDRPAVQLSRSPDGGGLDVLTGVAGSFRRGHDPGSFEADEDAERYDGVIATVPSGTFLDLLDPGLVDAIDGAYLD